MKNPNYELLVRTAHLLSPLLPEIVFVGGCTTALLITDTAAADVRPTYDVDVIAEISSIREHHQFSERLRRLGFREDTSDGAPICRWIHDAGATLDVMPLDENILGFSNRWYPQAMATSRDQVIEPARLTIRMVTATYFCATKLEAFRGRGKEDYSGSHDLEDLIAVIDGREELIDELSSAEAEVRSWIGAEAKRLLAQPAFVDSLQGHLHPDPGSQQRLSLLLERLRAISQL